ncbi:MAG: hypothetical protein LKCHEGNO_02325 [Burkholderiaceae bacterium]|nr:hypothetical protein [Burkholderiaceae bacterium]
MRGLGSPLRAHSGQVWLAMDLEPPSGADGTISRNEWSVTLQHHLRAQRRDGTTGSLDTVGLKLDRYMGPHLYLTGQAHSAYAGGAGAYSIGLIGAGLATAPAPRRFGVELLAGAAGGGGVASGNGAIAQSIAWAGWNVTPDSQLRFGVGGVKSIHGGNLKSGVVELSWTRALGLGGR